MEIKTLVTTTTTSGWLWLLPRSQCSFQKVILRQILGPPFKFLRLMGERKGEKERLSPYAFFYRLFHITIEL